MKQPVKVATPSRMQPGMNMNSALRYRHPTGKIAAIIALNTAIMSFGFFSLREYGMTPVLEAIQRQKGVTDEEVRTPLTWAAMRMYHLPDSALAGAILGGITAGMKSGPKRIIPGALTLGLTCSAFQLVVNEARVQRVRYVSRNATAFEQASNPLSNRSDVGVDTSGSLRAPLSEFDSREWEQSSRSTKEGIDHTVNDDDLEGSNFKDRLLSFIGFIKVSEEEYLRRLKAKREIHLQRIRELEEMLEKDGKLKKKEEN